MELHEIMSRAERDKADAARDGANAQGGETTAPGLKRKGVSPQLSAKYSHQIESHRLLATTASSKQYILRSTLHPAVIEAASVCDVEIEHAERAEIAVWHPNRDDHRPEGTLIAWKHANADQLGATGVMHVILALILVNGRVLSDSKPTALWIS